MTDKVALVVDDEQLIRMMTAEFLEDCGFTTYEAENGREALEFYHKVNPSVIILDLRMPIIDGFGFLEEANIPDNDSCDVIVLTGHGGVNDKSRSFELGAKGFFKKPFEHDELIKAAIELVENQSA